MKMISQDSNFDELMEFLIQRCHVFERIESSKAKVNHDIDKDTSKIQGQLRSHGYLISERPFKDPPWQSASIEQDTNIALESHITVLKSSIRCEVSGLEQLPGKRKIRVRFPIQPLAPHIFF